MTPPEPLRLTLEALIRRLHEEGMALHVDGSGWLVEWEKAATFQGFPATVNEWVEGATPFEAASKALGVPVVERDEVLRLTPDEQELVINILRNYHRDHQDDPEMGVWPTVARGLAERLVNDDGPANERDEAAELREIANDLEYQLRGESEDLARLKEAVAGYLEALDATRRHNDEPGEPEYVLSARESNLRRLVGMDEG